MFNGDGVGKLDPGPHRIRLYGYRNNEVLCQKTLNPSRPSYARMILFPEFVRIRRHVERDRFIGPVAIGPVLHACAVVPDLNSQLVVELGIRHRLLCASPPVVRSTMFEFQNFCLTWIKENIHPIEQVLTFEEWFTGLRFNKSRKDQLQKAHDEVIDINNLSMEMIELLKIKAFGKLEFKYSYGYSRTINPRSDHFKVIFGPLIKTIEEELVKFPWVAKGMDPHLLPSKLLEICSHDSRFIYGTDFSHLEGSYDTWIYELERELFKAFLPQYNWYWDFYFTVTNHVQILSIKDVIAVLKGPRMSGEMSTAVTHTWLNYMINAFNAVKQGVNIEVMVAGDDAIISADKELSARFIKELGFDFKMESYAFVWEAAFCHICFNPNTLHLFTNVAEVLLKLGWTLATMRFTKSRRVLSGLYKAKVMSYLSLYDFCPILSPFLYSQLQQLDCRPVFEEEHYVNFPWKTKLLYVKPDIVIDDEVYFEHIFNIPIETQRYLTKILTGVSVSDNYIPEVVDSILLMEQTYHDCIDYFNRYRC